jgi:PleD family two-component response regulator
VVVTDVTRIKQAELALHSATDELKELVRTDSLTGLLNRRAFDDAIENEIRRSGRTSAPLSRSLQTL